MSGTVPASGATEGAIAPGHRLGPYEIPAPLGEGGVGVVYRATDSKLRREVATKVLPEAFAADADRLARFEREAQVLARLQHPNIASIYGLEESGGVRALVMELVEGEDLAERLKRGPLPLEEALAVDKRADIWSFGVVLCEMLTGRRLFRGETITDVLASVVREPIDWDALPPGTPTPVRTLLRRCLERDPKSRMRDIGEARIALAGPSVPPADAQPLVRAALGPVARGTWLRRQGGAWWLRSGVRRGGRGGGRSRRRVE